MPINTIRAAMMVSAHNARLHSLTRRMPPPEILSTMITQYANFIPPDIRELFGKDAGMLMGAAMAAERAAIMDGIKALYPDTPQRAALLTGLEPYSYLKEVKDGRDASDMDSVCG